jgi:hypothetical protein
VMSRPRRFLIGCHRGPGYTRPVSQPAWPTARCSTTARGARGAVHGPRTPLGLRRSP